MTYHIHVLVRSDGKQRWDRKVQRQNLVVIEDRPNLNDEAARRLAVSLVTQRGDLVSTVLSIDKVNC